MSLPRYRLIEDAFFAPNLVPKGSIIETAAPPGPHVEPINEAARLAMESWYAQEYTFKVKDPNGGEDLVRTHRPHEELRIGLSGGAEPQAPVTILAPPPKNTAGDLSLATVNLRSSTSQRPGPAREILLPEEFREEAVAVEGEEPIVAVVAAAKPASTVTTSRRT